MDRGEVASTRGIGRRLSGISARLGVLLTLTVLFLMVLASAAHAAEPWVVSDKADYLPGSTVTLYGGDWAGDSQVRVQAHCKARHLTFTGAPV
jgi:hypothetical protein